jgi:hypothetical protein
MNLYAVKDLGQVVDTGPAAAQMRADGDGDAPRLLMRDRENAVAVAGLEK